MLSFGGREVFLSKDLPGHLNMVHLQRTGKLLPYIDDTIQVQPKLGSGGRL